MHVSLTEPSFSINSLRLFLVRKTREEEEESRLQENPFCDELVPNDELSPFLLANSIHVYTKTVKYGKNQQTVYKERKQIISTDFIIVLITGVDDGIILPLLGDPEPGALSRENKEYR